MRHPYFNKAVTMAYERLIQPNENPNYFIYLEVDPQTIDVNIHPTKTEIKFENEPAIWSIISATVKEALGKFNVAPPIDFDQEGAPDIPVNIPLENIRPPQTSFNPSYNPFGTNVYKRESVDWEKLYSGFEQKVVLPDMSNENANDSMFAPSLVEENTQKQIALDESKTQNFQLKQKYILTPVKSGLLLVDQQRAHVRILFDLFLRQLQETQGTSQQLLFPEELALTANDTIVFEQLIPDLQKVGFDIKVVENDAYSIKGVPAILGTGSTIDLLLKMIENAGAIEVNAVTKLHEMIALALAESSSLKTGQHLTENEMTNLIDRLFACPSHNHTPNGKKIMTILSYEEIEGKFR